MDGMEVLLGVREVHVHRNRVGGSLMAELFGYDPEVINGGDSIPYGLCEVCYRSPCECNYEGGVSACDHEAKGGDGDTAELEPDPDLQV